MNNFKKLLEQSVLNESIKDFFSKAIKKLSNSDKEKMYNYFDDGDMWDLWFTFEDRATKLMKKEVSYVISKNKGSKEFTTSYSMGMAMAIVVKRIMNMSEIDRNDFVRGMENAEWDV